MQSAYLHNGTIVTASEYSAEKHGSRIYCIDQSCKTPVIFVPKGKNNAAYFKTTGKKGSQHQKSCGFYESLDFVNSVKKVAEYQDGLLDQGIRENVIRVSMNRIDPEYESNSVKREKRQDKSDKEGIKVKDENKPPTTISSVKSVVKLMTSYEPDILATVLINLGGGRKLPLSSVIVDQEKAHNMLWSDELISDLGYFVYGQVEKVVQRQKVKYINFKSVNETPFTLVLFEKYWREFDYSDDDLEGKDVLVYGHLRKNDYNERNETEMIIKSDKYIEFFKRKEKQIL